MKGAVLRDSPFLFSFCLGSVAFARRLLPAARCPLSACCPAISIRCVPGARLVSSNATIFSIFSRNARKIPALWPEIRQKTVKIQGFSQFSLDFYVHISIFRFILLHSFRLTHPSGRKIRSHLHQLATVGEVEVGFFHLFPCGGFQSTAVDV